MGGDGSLVGSSGSWVVCGGSWVVSGGSVVGTCWLINTMPKVKSYQLLGTGLLLSLERHRTARLSAQESSEKFFFEASFHRNRYFPD